MLLLAFFNLVCKVFRTPNSTKLLSILHKMLLIERDTPSGDITWSGLETMADAALKIYSEQQEHRVATSGLLCKMHIMTCHPFLMEEVPNFIATFCHGN